MIGIRSFHARLALGGLTLVPLSLIISSLMGNGIGASGQVFVIPFAAAAFIGLLFPTRLAAVAPAFLFIVVGILLTTVDMQNFAHVESSRDFVPAMIRLVGWVVASAGAIGAIVQRLRHTNRGSIPTERRILGAVAVAVALIAGVSFLRDAADRSASADTNGAIRVSIRSNRFDPSDLTFLTEVRARVYVRNLDSYAHTFTVHGLGIDQYIGPGSTRLILLKRPLHAHGSGRPTTLTLSCSVTGHDRMTGVIRFR